jgi:hypothetical protein
MAPHQLSSSSRKTRSPKKEMQQEPWKPYTYTVMYGGKARIVELRAAGSRWDEALGMRMLCYRVCFQDRRGTSTFIWAEQDQVIASI